MNRRQAARARAIAVVVLAWRAWPVREVAALIPARYRAEPGWVLDHLIRPRVRAQSRALHRTRSVR